ncbi:MAG: SPASM domain-containing protein [Armatimonadetes bacterium]|nr:SPASM domain-containing protein [Armatimonadota bacterium]
MSPGESARDGWELGEIHLVEQLGTSVVVDVRRGLLFEADEPTAAFVRSARAAGDLRAGAAEVRRRWGWWRMGRVWHELQRAGLLTRRLPDRPPAPWAVLPPVTSLDLNITHQCNLACRYCYGAYGTTLPACEGRFRYGSAEGWMSEKVAAAAFEWLLRASGQASELALVFFGGEPLLNWRLFKRLVPQFRQRAEEAGKRLHLATATNATLLTQRKLDFLIESGIGIQFSVDGPPDIQDDQRADRTGQGTHALVEAAARRLFARRPGQVTARATLTRRHLDVRRVVEHLLGLGFGSVHVEPATGIANEYAVTADCLPELKQQLTGMAELFLERLDGGELLNFSNFVKYVQSTKDPQKPRFYPCGAGRGYLCADPTGTLYLCHRFTGTPEYAMGNIFEGLDETVRRCVSRLHVDARPGCRDCWARYHCGGGCWRVHVDASGTLEEPDAAFHCPVQRHTIELAIAINARLADAEAELLADQYGQSKMPHES